MIDINQLPKNPAWERWKADLRAEGAAEGAARMLLRILRRRGFAVGVDVEARVLATTDPGCIERWADRTFDAAFADD